jgi:pyruvate formate-lyase/glycerol dehydratase family glycyl radical enzyme
MSALTAPRLALLRDQATAVKCEPDLERATLLTEAYQAHLEEPTVVRRCAALAHVLEESTPRILPGELIVGYQAATSNWNLVAYPEFWGEAPPQTGDATRDAVVRELHAFWVAHPELRARGNLFGHCVPGYERVLRRGFVALAEDARALEGATTARPDYFELDYTADDFRRALATLAEGCAQYGRNYAAAAERLAADEDDPERQAELRQIAEVCARVPAYGARTFHEALQALWFCLLFVELEDPPNAHSLGRLDVLLGPFYEADLAAGRLDRAQAKDLLAAFWLKVYKSYDVQNGMIGGVDTAGQDVTNEVSRLVLEVMDELHLARQTSVRWHAGTPPDFLEHACAVVSHGLDQPQFFNDDAIVPALVNKGIPLEHARQYAIIGCIEVTIAGMMDPRAVAYYCNLLKCLELALNDGVDMLSGEQVGPRTGDATGFGYDDLRAAYRAQLAADLGRAVERLAGAEAGGARHFPMPMLSLFTDDCLAQGLDMTAGGARYNATSVCAMGIPNVADALTAIRQLVFEDRALTMAELLEALRADFAGHEDLRQRLLHGAPKYGNNDAAVDDLADALAAEFCTVLDSFPHPRGGRYHAHLFTFTQAITGGAVCAASADGRHARENLANSLMPHPGRGRSGPAAALLSAAHIDQTRAAAGTSLICELHPTALPRGGEAELLAELVTTYFQGGGMHLEFNIVGAEQLQAAQREPEKWSHLAVRVSGYSAYFTTLRRDIQDHIIQRSGN